MFLPKLEHCCRRGGRLVRANGASAPRKGIAPGPRVGRALQSFERVEGVVEWIRG